MTDSLYEDAVRAAKEHVTAGDVFQVVLSQRFDLDDLGADPFDVYRVLRLVNPSPYLYFLRFPEVTVVGASPEPMVRLREGTVDLAAHRRLETPGGHARGGRPARGRAGRGPEGGGRARDAGGPGPQRRGPGGHASAPRWSTR